LTGADVLVSPIAKAAMRNEGGGYIVIGMREERARLISEPRPASEARKRRLLQPRLLLQNAQLLVHGLGFSFDHKTLAIIECARGSAKSRERFGSWDFRAKIGRLAPS
jgi:hypothetical protein